MPNPRQDEPDAKGFKALDKAADAAETAARKTADEAANETRSFAERAESDARKVAETAEAIAAQSSQTATAALGLLDQATPDPAAARRSAEALAARMRELSVEWFEALREQTTKNLDGFARLAECRSPLDLVRVQAELARERFGDSVLLARRLNSASLRALGGIAQDSAEAAQTRRPAL